MARAMNTTADQRYRAVVTFTKIAPLWTAQGRDAQRQRSWYSPRADYYENLWREDDATIGDKLIEIIGHYDTMTPVKQAVNKAIKRKGDHYRLDSIEFQIAPLVWQTCDDKGAIA